MDAERLIGRKFKLPCFCIIAFFMVFGFYSPINANAQEVSQVETVEFCELINNADIYNGKTIRLKAIYRFGLDWAELYCLNCDDQRRVAYDSSGSFDKLTSSKIRKKIKWSPRGKTVNIVAVGKFHNRNPGDKSGVSYKLVIDYIESADVIFNDSPVNLPEKYKKKASCVNEAQ